MCPIYWELHFLNVNIEKYILVVYIFECVNEMYTSDIMSLFLKGWNTWNVPFVNLFLFFWLKKLKN